MKKIKKIMALAIAMVMVLGMSTMAWADETPTTYTVAVKNDATGFTYQAYQIFTGELNGDTLSNVQWGSGISDAGKAALRTKYSLTANSDTQKDARAVAEAIAADTATDKADAIATLLAKTTTGGLGTSIPMNRNESITVNSETFKGYAATGQTPGWYLIVNTAVPTGADNVTYSDYIVQVVKDVAIAPKSDKPSSVKKVDDINDSTGTENNLQDSADHDIGDVISYTLTATLPQDYANYDKYYLQFQDDMSKGLTLNTNSVKIFYGDSDTTGTAITFTAADGTSYTDGQLYTYTIADVKTTASALGAGDVIKITYTATLNNYAVIGEAGNPNKYRIEFFNNPNNTGDGAPHGTTPWDVNIVFTYKTVFNKEDGATHKPLTGADFELYKFIKSGSGTETYKTLTGNWTKVTDLGDGTNKPSKSKDTYTKTGEGAGTAENAKFTFSGLDDGYYKLVETVTPDGYNTIDDVYFEITADHDVLAEDPKLKSLSGAEGTTFTMTADKAAGSLTNPIENNAGTVLPSTGGMGTTIFYVIGAILVLGAGILLVSKRRMSAN